MELRLFLVSLMCVRIRLKIEIYLRYLQSQRKNVQTTTVTDNISVPPRQKGCTRAFARLQFEYGYSKNVLHPGITLYYQVVLKKLHNYSYFLQNNGKNLN